MQKIKRMLEHNRMGLASGMGAFLLPMLIFAVALALVGIYPFGDKSLLIIDMNSEYVDYLAQMNESLRSGQSLVRSWNMGMGLNMLGLIAFYTASPFNLLVMLFPVEAITEVLFAITLLKIGLAGLNFSLYASYAHGRSGVLSVAFSVAYALNSYGIAYASNIMWLDGMAFLPIVILGVEMLLREDRWGIILLGLLYVFLSSYYIGYMIGAFSLLYFLAGYFSHSLNLRAMWPKLGRLLGAALAAAGCLAFLLVPAFLGLKNGQSTMFSIPSGFAMEKPFLHIAARMLPGVYDTLTDSGYPNVYCTVAGVFFCVLYFLHSGIALREKLIYGGFLAFLIFSFSSAILDLAWHAFESPTWFPARYSFVFCFLVLSIGLRAVSHRQQADRPRVAGCVLILLIFTVEIGVFRFRYVELWSLAAGIILAVLYGVIYRFGGAGHSGERRSRLLATSALLLVCAETFANACAMEKGLDEQFAYKTRESYLSYREAYLPAVEETARLHGTDPYRLEVVEQRNANGGMALGYNGISHYSTTTDQALNLFLRALGYNKGTDNELRFTPNTPLTGGLLGIRYVLSPEVLDSGYAQTAQVGAVGVFENLCAFPLAYPAPERALDWHATDGGDPFALQNEFLGIVSGRLSADAFQPVTEVEVELYNADLDEREGYLELTPRVRGETAAMEYRISNPEKREVYAYFPVLDSKFSAASIYVNGVSMGRDLHYRGNTVLPLGNGEEIRLRLELGPSAASIRAQHFYSLDMELAMDIASEQRERAMEFERFTDTTVSGIVTAAEGEVLLTNFPMDTGWRAYVDGERVETKPFAGVFLAVPLEPGEHRIDLRYSPPGFAAGCGISAASTAGLLLLYLLKQRKSRS